MSRLLGRFRVLLPPSAYVVLYAAIYLIVSLPAIVAARGVGAAAIDQKFREMPAAVHLIGMLIYGVYRAAMFHPFFRPGYRRWLETTPWSWGKPLPVGPAHPTWGDAVLVAAAGLPAWLSGDVHPITSYALALAGYLLALSATFAKTGAWAFPFPVLFGLGLALMLCRGRPESYGAAVLASAVVAMIGLRRSFRRWPWADVASIVYDPTRGFFVEGKAPALGWPFDRLGPRHDPPRGRSRRSPARSSGPCSPAGGFMCSSACSSPRSQLFVRLIVAGNLANLLGIYRLVTMLSGYASPINLAGRIARFRPLIPSYDQVFLVPIAAFLVALVGPGALALGGIPINVAVAVSASLALMTLWLGGPDRRTWQLTARHRIVSGIGGNTNRGGEFVQTG